MTSFPMHPIRSPNLAPVLFLFLVLVFSISGAARAAQVAPAPWIGVRAASAPPELTVRFEEAALVVAGASAGGDVAFYSVAREPHGVYQSVVRRRGVALADGLGEARIEVERPGVPLKSVWAVVDVASGAYAVAAPEGFRLREMPFPGRGFAAGAPGRVDRLRQESPSVDLLVVRPGVGAWSLHALDQGVGDRDGIDDDRVLTSLDDLESLEDRATAPPEEYSRDDVVIFIEPRELRYAATRLVGKPTPGDEGDTDGKGGAR